MEYEDKTEEGINKRYVTKFLIYEVSIVGAPADCTVGFRAFDTKTKENNMEKTEEKNRLQ